MLNEVHNVLPDNMLYQGRKGAEKADKVGDLRFHLNEGADTLNENFLDVGLRVAYTRLSI